MEIFIILELVGANEIISCKTFTDKSKAIECFTEVLNKNYSFEENEIISFVKDGLFNECDYTVYFLTKTLNEN